MKAEEDRFETWSLRFLERVNEACDQFRAAIQTRQQPLIEDYAADIPEPERSKLLRELLVIELEGRFAAGQTPAAQEYELRFPGHHDWIHSAFQSVLAANATDSRIAPTATLDDYELHDQIGAGGMGVVYRAYQRRADRFVALKVIRSGELEKLSSDKRQEWIERFKREGRVAAALEHDHVVTVYEVGEIDGQHFYSMRYVQGHSLDGELRDGPLANRKAAGYLEPISRAVHYAHTKGVIHRDIKPKNVLVDSVTARPLIADFGLAKVLEATPHVTLHGAVFGSPPYMSPEQAADSTSVTEVSDVYSLGATLYELVTGRPPFQAATVAETLNQVKYNDPVPPRQLNPGVDPDLETICLKCLEKEKSARYTSAEALADELGRYLRREPIRARPIGLSGRLWRWCRRNPVPAGLVAAVMISLLGGAGLATYFAVQEANRASEAIASDRAATREKNRANAKSDELQHKLAAEYLEAGMRAIDEGDVSGSLVWCAEALRLDSGDPRQEYSHRLRLAALFRDCPRLLQILEHDGPVTHAEFSPDDQRILTASADHTARIWDARTGLPLTPPLEHHDVVNYATFSSDGARVVTASKDGTAIVWNVVTGMQLTPPLEHQAAVLRANFSPDCLRVVTASADHTARVWDAATGQPITASLRHDPVSDFERVAFQGVLDAQFSSDGRLVTGGSDGTARIWNAETGEALAMLQHFGAVTNVRFTPGGQFVVTSSMVDKWNTPETQYGARVWDPASDQVTTLPQERSVNTIAVSPDGRMVATGGFGIARTYVIPTGKSVSPPLRHGEEVTCAVFSPDSRYLLTASTDYTARIWDARSGERLVAPMRHGQGVLHASFSSDGERIVTASDDRTARVWEVATAVPTTSNLSQNIGPRSSQDQHAGRVLQRSLFGVEICDLKTGASLTGPLEHKSTLNHAEFSPDGQYVATASADATARIWNSLTGDPVGVPLRHNDSVAVVTFSPDSRRVATASRDGSARVWDTSTGEPISLPLKHRPRSPALPPSSMPVPGRGFASTRAITGEEGVLYVAFSPDGRRLISAGTDNSARIWDALTGQETVPALAHTDVVTFAAFSPDGLHVVTVSRDHTARIWDSSTGYPICTPLMHAGAVTHAAFSSDGRLVVTLSDSVRLWEVITGKPITLPWKARAPEDYKYVGFAPDDTEVIATGGATGAWRLHEDRRPTQDILRHAQVLAGRRISGRGGLVPLENETLLGDWNALPSKQVFRLSAPEVVVWHRREGEECSRTEQWHGAALHLGFLIQSDPTNAGLIAKRSVCHHQLGRWDLAMEDLSRAIELKTDDADLWQQRAELFSERMQWDEAIADFSEAIDLRSDDAFRWHRRGEIYAALKRLREAESDFEQCERLSQTRSLCHHHALIRLACGDLDGYRRVCADAIGRLLHSLGHVPDVDRDGMVKFLAPQYSDFFLPWTCVLGADAIPDLSFPTSLVHPDIRAKAAQDSTVNDRMKHADAEASEGNDGIKRQQQAYRYAELLTHGALLYRAGHFSQAVSQLEAAVRLNEDGENSYAWLFLAMAHTRLQEIDVARKLFEKVTACMDRLKHQSPTVPVMTGVEPKRFVLLRHPLGGFVQDEELVPLQDAPAMADSKARLYKPSSSWVAQLELQVLHQEAESLLKISNQPSHEYESKLASHRIWIETIETLAKDEPRCWEYQHQIASSYFQLAGRQSTAEDRGLAVESLQKAISVEENVVTVQPDVKRYSALLGLSYFALADLRNRMGQSNAANETYSQSIATLEEALSRISWQTAQEGEDPDTVHDDALDLRILHTLARSLDGRANFRTASGSYPQALSDRQRALQIWEELATKRRLAMNFESQLAFSYSAIGHLQQNLDQVGPADASLQKAIAVRQGLVDRNPDTPEYRVELADSIAALGYLQQEERKLNEAKQSYQEVIEIQQRLVSGHPQNTALAVRLSASYFQMGSVLNQLDQPGPALEWFAKAIETLQPALSDASENVSARELIENCNWGQITSRLAATNDYVGAARQAAELLGVNANAMATRYNAACVFSLLSAAARADQRISEEQRVEQAEQYARRAVQLLAQASEGGFFSRPPNLHHLKMDPDLDPIRTREDFKQLQQEWDGRIARAESTNSLPVRTFESPSDFARARVIDWLQGNNAFGTNSDFIRFIGEQIDKQSAHRSNLAFFFGPSLMKSGKPTQLYVWDDEVFAFELSEAQSRRLQLDSNTIQFRAARSHARKRTPTLFMLDTLKLDQVDRLRSDTQITGSVCVHILGASPVKCVVRLSYQLAGKSTSLFFYVDEPVGEDRVVAFSFSPIRADSNDEQYVGPLALFLDICTIKNMGDTEEITSISNLTATLVDLNGAED